MKKLRLILLSCFFATCYPKEEVNVPIREVEAATVSKLDQFIQEKFIDRYGMVIRYKFSDVYVNFGERATPPSIESVRPMLDFVQRFWVDPYNDIPNGTTFFEEHVPAEIIFLGGLIYNNDGTATLGRADAGARITFTNVNAIDPSDPDWRRLQLQTVYHEFAHTVHQLYKLPNAFETITPVGYTGPGSWFTLTEIQALERGFVSPYATVSPNEDFAETVAFYLFEPNFDENFIKLDLNCKTNNCEKNNEGKAMIAAKLAAIKDHYEKQTGVDLVALRDAIQSRL